MKSMVYAAMIGTVVGHGFLVTPASRKGGQAYEKACGPTIALKDKSDYTQEVQTLGTSPGPACDLFLCKGYKFADVLPTDIQLYTLNQNVTFRYSLTIPHPSNDPTNITVIDMSTRQVISPDLFQVASLGDRVAQLDLGFKMPAQMPQGKCVNPGDCVLAVNWDAVDINQTFQSCVDFVLQ